MAYKPIFAKPYEDGWKDLPIEETGITADILNMYDTTFEAMETQLKKTTEVFNDNGTISATNFSVDENGNCNIKGKLQVSGKPVAGSSTVIFDSHETAQEALKGAQKDDYTAGQTIRIKNAEQSDLWIYTVNDSSQSYSYNGDLEGDIDAAEDGILQIGYFSVALVKGKGTASGGGTGENGASAYEIAVKNGFEGSETDWLASLKGEPGGAYTEEDKQELMTYIDQKFTDLTGDILGGAS